MVLAKLQIEMNQLPDIRQLRIFLTLEETRSFTGAASQLQITQSAVSHSIKSLESLLNCTLIERLGKKCILTPHGEVFLHHATLAIKQLESASLKIKTLNDWGYSSLKIGASNTLCQYVVPKALANFYGKEQRCEVFITANDTKALVKLLKNGELDIAFGIRLNSLENDHQFIPIASDTLCFISSTDHAWCSSPPQSPEDFEKERFIVYGNDSVTENILNSHLPGIGIKQRSSLGMNNMESIKEMATLGLGVGIVSEWIVENEVEANTLAKHSITPPPAREWGYYLSRSKSLSLTEEKFLKCFSESLTSVISS